MSNTRRGGRHRLTTAVTLASAGVLAVSVVTAPPHRPIATSEVRAVRLAVSTVAVQSNWPALPERISNHVRTEVVARGLVDLAAEFVNAPAEAVSTSPAPGESKKDLERAAATTATAAAISIPPQLLPIVGPILLFGPVILLVVLACPPCALFNVITFAIQSFFLSFAPVSAVSAAPTSTEEAVAVTVAAPVDEVPVRNSANAVPVDDNEVADVSRPPAAVDTPTSTDQPTSAEPAAADDTEQEPADPPTSSDDETDAVDTDDRAAEPDSTDDREADEATSASRSDQTPGHDRGSSTETDSAASSSEAASTAGDSSDSESSSDKGGDE